VPNSNNPRRHANLILALLIPASLACGIVQVSSNSGTITITDLYTTGGLDASGQPMEPDSEFETSQDRIYLVVTIDSPSPVPVGVRWFFGDELIYEEATRVDNAAYWFIGPPPGQEFEVGSYHAEVYLVQDPVRSVDFVVVP